MNPAAKCGCTFAMVRRFCVVIGVLFGMVLPVSQSQASGWSLNSSVSERLTFNDNRRQATNSSGDTYGAITGIFTDFAWQGPRLEINLSSNLNINRFFGPGANSDLDTIGQFYKGVIQKNSRKTNVVFSSSFQIQDTTFSELEDTGILSQNKNNRLTYATKATVSHKVNSRLKASLLASVNIVDFSVQSAALTPFLDADLEASLIHDLSQLTQVKFSLGWSLFKADNATNTVSQTYTADGFLTTQLSPRLSVSALVGVSINQTKKDANLGVSASSRTAIGSVLELGLDYKLATTQFSLTVSRGLEPSASGEVQQSDSVRASVARQINSHSNINLSASALQRKSLSNSGGTDRKIFILSPSYSYIFTRNWRAGMGYSFRFQNSNGTKTTSNSVFVSLTRDFSILP